MFKKFISKLLLCLSLGPIVGLACTEENFTARRLDREYAGITALPVARHLRLGNCFGRRLEKITMTAYAVQGPVFATLLVNGLPVGVTQEVGSTLQTYEFKLDPDYNVIDEHIRTIEIRIGGHIYIDRLEGFFVKEADYWDSYGTYLGSTSLFSCEQGENVHAIAESFNPFSMIIMVAREGDFYLHRAKVTYADGVTESYGEIVIPQNTARRIDNVREVPIESVTIVGNSARDCETVSARLDLRLK